MQYVGIPTYCFLYDGSPVGAGHDGKGPGMTDEEGQRIIFPGGI